MLDVKDVIRSRYRREIHQKQREANALSIEVGLEAEEETDVVALAETARSLDIAIEILDEAKMRLKQLEATTS